MKSPATALLATVALFSVILTAQGCTETEPGRGGVVLRVNGREVTFAEFEKLLLADGAARDFREELIDRLLIEEAAAKAGVTVTDEEVNERQEEQLVIELCRREHDVDGLTSALRASGYENCQERMKVTAPKTKMLLLAEKMIKKERTTEENMKNRFREESPEAAGKVAWVYHMMISAEETIKDFSHEILHLECMLKLTSPGRKEKFEKQIAELRQKLTKWKKLDSKKVAKEVVEKLRAGGDFVELAKEYGTGYSAEFYDKGWISRKHLHDDVIPAIFEQLKNGEVSDPIKSKYGYHVVKLLGLKDASEINYDDVWPWLLKDMGKRGVERREFTKFFLNLRGKTRIERFNLPRAAD